MKKFKFSLDGVLNVKEKLEGQAKVSFGVAMAKLNSEIDVKNAMLARQDEYNRKLTDSINGALNVLEIAKYRDAIDVLQEQIEAQELVIIRAQRQVELERAKLNTLMTERKTIDKLKEKKFNEYLNEINAEERKEIDELVSYRQSTGSQEEEDG